jgi:predicted dehydrogenase
MVANAAIVGLGRWGQTIVASVEGKSAAIRFTAGVTRMHAKAAEIAAVHLIPLVDDYHAVLADTKIDAAVIATLHSRHAEQTDLRVQRRQAHLRRETVRPHQSERRMGRRRSRHG